MHGLLCCNCPDDFLMIARVCTNSQATQEIMTTLSVIYRADLDMRACEMCGYISK